MFSTCTSQWSFIRIMLYSTLAATIYSTCQRPPDLPFAVPNVDKVTFEEGESVSYSCLPSYKPIPSRNNTAICGTNENWSSPEDFCQKLDCGIPDILENGNVEFVDTVFESNASYKCMEGYIMFGSDTRYCLADEKWNGIVPSCDRTCPEPPNVQFAIIKAITNITVNYYPQSSKVDYSCISGFTSANILFTICQSDFTWSRITEFCTRVSCGSPGTVENGNINMKDDKFQSKAFFVCNEGYKLDGDTYRECMEDGAWSGSTPTCKRSCPDPPIVPNAEVIEIPDIPFFTVGIIINYKCLPGYKYDPFLSPSIKCLEGYTWSNATEFCKKVICGQPERIKNGNVQITGLDFGSIASYSCNKGFSLIGNPQRKCTADAVWAGSPPVCQ